MAWCDAAEVGLAVITYLRVEIDVNVVTAASMNQPFATEKIGMPARDRGADEVAVILHGRLFRVSCSAPPEGALSWSHATP